MGSNPKILIVRFSSIGDIVLTTPVARCLKQQLGAEVHYLTKERFRPVLEANPYIDVLHTIKKSVAEAVPALKAARFDYLADLHGNLRTLQLKLALGIPGASFSKLNLEKWLLVRTKADYLPRLHIVDRYMAVVHKLGVRYDGQGLDYFLPKDTEMDVRTLFEKKGYAGYWDGRFAAFAIGAAHATKRLPAGQVAEVCRRLSWPVLLLGGPEDREAGEAVTRQAGPPYRQRLRRSEPQPVGLGGEPVGPGYQPRYGTDAHSGSVPEAHRISMGKYRARFRHDALLPRRHGPQYHPGT
jgi:ADP-heptose:LPS heptosyltransferase